MLRVKSERLETRVTLAQKELVMRAAALQGRSITDFVLDSVTQAAKQVVNDSEVIKLSARDQKAFVKSLLRPAMPNAKLRAAAQWYKRRTGRA